MTRAMLLRGSQLRVLLVIVAGRARTLEEIGAAACVSLQRAHQIIEHLREVGAVIRIPARFQMSSEWREIVEASKRQEESRAVEHHQPTQEIEA